jgi:hypothetical protein
LYCGIITSAAAVFEVVDGHLDDLFGIFQGVVLVELDVDHVVLLHLGDGVGGDQLGVEALGHVGQVLDDALDVHHHGVAGAGDDGQFLLQVGAGLGHAVALENLVGRAADAAQLDALGALGFGVVDHFRFLGRGHDHLGEHRLMAVDDDVDVVFLHDAQVGFGLQRIGGAEEHVLQVGGQHGAAPAVGHGGAGALFDQVFVVLVHAHVGAVHDFDDFAVDVARKTPFFSIFRRALPARVSGRAARLRPCPIRSGLFRPLPGRFRRCRGP